MEERRTGRSNLREYNAARIARGQVKLSAGIGINTGPVILGTVGEPGRMDATVISDTVNLASRVEGLTRHYDASLLITEHTLIRLADPTKYKYRMLDRVQVKGKKQSVSIFEVFDGDEPADVERKILTQQLFEQGVQAYLSCNFSGAIRLMGLVLEKNPSDRPAELYLQRSEYFAVHGVPPDWEGVAVMDSK